MPTEKELFLKKFNPEKHGFESPQPFDDDYPLGFSVKKKLDNGDIESATLLSIYIPYRTYNNESFGNKKPINIHASYGKISDNGVMMRDTKDAKLTDPIDVEIPNNKYFYDIKTKKFFKKKKEIEAEKIINEAYHKHIETTKPIKGLASRIKLLLWRKIISKIFQCISKFFYYLLLIVSGNRFTYEPILGDETVNDTVVKSELGGINLKMKKVLEKGKKFKLLNYEASRWSIIFYSLLHFSLFLISFYNDFQSELANTIISNNFLTLLYAIITLWLLETIIPSILMSLIRYFSTQSANALYKTIRL